MRSTIHSTGCRFAARLKNPQPQVRVSVRPGAAANSFDVSAVITDRQTGNVLAEPKMSVKAGSWAQSEVGQIGVPGVASVALSVTVDPSGKHAAYSAEIHRADGRSDSETGTLLIAR